MALRQPAWDLKAENAPVLIINAKGAVWEADDMEYICSLSKLTNYRVKNGIDYQLML